MNKDFARGMIVSLALKSLPVRKKTPIAYLYNGVRLPALPEWDKTVYPYALISHGGKNDQGSTPYAYLYLSTTELYRGYANNLISLVLKGSDSGSAIRYKIDIENGDTDWSLDTNFNRTYSADGQVSTHYRVDWANYAVYNKPTDGYYEFSEPIPIYNEPVNYLYNGVKLPKLPEWDKTVYPYAFVFYSNLDADYFLITFNKQPIAYYPDYSEFLYIGSPDKISYQFWGKSSQWNERVEPFLVRENADGYGMSAEKELWTDNDIFYEDGTIYLAASDPIPIYE